MQSIYLDHAATTPVHPRVVEAMLPYLTQVYGNPSSTHAFGRKSRSAVEAARDAIAAEIGVSPLELVFTAGGTEADNLALIGTARAYQHKGKHIITTSVEHHAVLHACAQLEREGFDVTYLPVDETGRISLDELQAAIRPDTILVSVLYGNNEVGTIQPIAEIGAILRERGILFHTDAVQAFGLIQLNANDLNVDLLSVASHKVNGPKGVGALFVSRRVKLSPLLHGGSQERKRRAGTENVAGIVGFAEAVKVAAEERTSRFQSYQAMREGMIRIWREQGLSFAVNGHPTEVLPHILNVSFFGADTETMLMNLDLAGIAASSGSACSSGSLERSHVLQAMFPHDEARVRSAIRFSFGLTNSLPEVEQAAVKVAELVRRIAK